MERATAVRNESKKRKVVEDEGDKEASKKSKKTTKPVKPPQGCLAELTPGQIAQMKRMRITPEQMKIYTHTHGHDRHAPAHHREGHSH